MINSSINLLDAALIFIGAFIFLLFIYFTITSLLEKESRAANIAFSLSLSLPIPYLLIGLTEFEYQNLLAIILLIMTAIPVIIYAFPSTKKRFFAEDTPKTKIDERDIMFSRRLLKEGTERFHEYYTEKPEYKILDDKFRSKPGLLKKGAAAYNPYLFSTANASFEAVEVYKQIVDGKISDEKINSDPLEITLFIKQWAKKLGAVTVGITELKNYHLYSYVGRGSDYGKPVVINHKFAIALTVEMDKFMLDNAPLGPAVMESAQQYLNSGAIAIQIAEFIRRLGYPARAHIDGNYRVVCPLVSRDAGLGEIGRMGLLMTPELGPRVRIAVVTTDLHLIIDRRKYDYSMIDFCTQCKKCADACPSKAISFSDREEIDGVKRWKINSEECFTFWCAIGTDCGRCVSVCPYSHPDNLMHNLVRYGVKNSSLFRKTAIKLDDFFYGRIPPTSDLPDWMGLKPNKDDS